MQKSTKTSLNFLFFLLCAGGFAIIFFNEKIDHHLAPLFPTFAIILYGLIISGAIKNCGDYSLAEQLSDSIKAYLDEKVENAATVDRKEKEYISALDRFIQASESYASMLEKQNHQFGDIFPELYETAGKMRDQLNSLPLNEINEDLNRFRGETGELNLVLDSLVEILENKVEKVR